MSLFVGLQVTCTDFPILAVVLCCLRHCHNTLDYFNIVQLMPWNLAAAVQGHVIQVIDMFNKHNTQCKLVVHPAVVDEFV